MRMIRSIGNVTDTKVKGSIKNSICADDLNPGNDYDVDDINLWVRKNV